MSSRDAGKLAVAVVLAAAVVNSSAQSPEELERCRTLADPAARLACYDAAAAAMAVPQKPPAAPDAARPPGDAGPDAAAQLVPTGSLKGGQSLIAQRWELEDRYNLGTFRFTFYRPNYILPVVYSSGVNDRPQTPTQPAPVLPGSLDRTEAEFQLSFKMKLWEDIMGSQSDLWLGYTQKSSWQVYNEELSRPFRETNYEPELIWSIPTNYEIFGLKGRLLALGLVHQSNGRGDPLSRSWNRVYAMAALERGPFVLQVKPWYRFSEDDSKDDNPDIKDYIGSAESSLLQVAGTADHHAATANHVQVGSELGLRAVRCALSDHVGISRLPAGFLRLWREHDRLQLPQDVGRARRIGGYLVLKKHRLHRAERTSMEVTAQVAYPRDEPFRSHR
jgi:phospholipase A1